jgi:regulator of replication initiation timing
MRGISCWRFLAFCLFSLSLICPAFGQDTPSVKDLTEQELQALALTLSEELLTSLKTRPDEIAQLRDENGKLSTRLMELGANLEEAQKKAQQSEADWKSSESGRLRTQKKLTSLSELYANSIAEKDKKIRDQSLLLKIEGIGIAVVSGIAIAAISIAALK